MKFLLSMLVYLLMAFLIGWGIYSLVQPDGKPWLLMGSLVAYLVIVARTGCSETH